MQRIDLGKIGLTAGGAWDSRVSYERLTLVTHEGSAYVSITSSTGITPGTNSSVWVLLFSSSQGGSGDSISVEYFTDGVLYWKKNGEWLLDPSGQKIPVFSSGGGTNPSGTGETDIQIRFSSVEEPGNPTNNGENWTSAGNGSGILWIAIRIKSGGVWGSWNVIRIKGETGSPGVAPNASFKSIVFVRMNGTPDTPTGGSYNSPVPTSLAGQNAAGQNVYWEDGIPAGGEMLWASSRIFSSDGNSPQQANWSTPRQMTDTDKYDVEFAFMQTNDAVPAAPIAANRHSDSSPYGYSAQVWFDPEKDKYSASGVLRDFTTVYWRAERECVNGVWGDWVIMRIKGEKGTDGTSVRILGTLDNTSELPPSGNVIGDAYLINGHLWVWDGDSWEDCGEIKGPTGDPGSSPVLHIKYSNDGGLHFTNNNGEDPGDWIGIYWDYIVTDSSTPSDYIWSYAKGKDGFGYEYIFKLTEDNTAPAVPATPAADVTVNGKHFQDDDFVPTGWTDDPDDVTTSYPYQWVCYRKKTDGQWGDYIGSASNPGYAARFCHLGETGQSSFKSTVFVRMNGTPSRPTGGSFVSPSPATLAGQDSTGTNVYWSDGIPPGGEMLWASTRIFTSDGNAPQTGTWSEPRQMTDTATYDVEFAFMQADDVRPAAPTTANRHGGSGTQVWFDPDLDKYSNPPTNTILRDFTNAYWRAERECLNGEWGDWVIIRIKGEKGDDGTSITIKGSFTDPDNLPAAIDCTVGDAYLYTGATQTKNGQTWTTGHLYIWDGDSWADAGQLQGPAGTSQYLHIKYSNDGGSTFTGNNGEDPGDYIGLLVNGTPVESSTPGDYTWSYAKGQDGFGYEYIYTKTQAPTAPAVPATPEPNVIVNGKHFQDDDFVPTGWEDDLPDADPNNFPFVWECYRKKTNGVWGDFRGSSSNSGYASFRAYYPKDGRASLKSVVFVRMNGNPQPPTNGDYLHPSPNDLAGQNSTGTNVYWSDGIPAGSEKLWASSRIFTSDGAAPQQASWSTPRQMTDTATYDVEFAFSDSKPANPSTNNRHKDTSPYGYSGQVWFDPDADKYRASNTLRDFTAAVWRAERECVNGVWGEWVVVRIKGENGVDGTPAYWIKAPHPRFTYRASNSGALINPSAISDQMEFHYGNTVISNTTWLFGSIKVNIGRSGSADSFPIYYVADLGYSWFTDPGLSGYQYMFMDESGNMYFSNIYSPIQGDTVMGMIVTDVYEAKSDYQYLVSGLTMSEGGLLTGTPNFFQDVVYAPVFAYPTIPDVTTFTDVLFLEFVKQRDGAEGSSGINGKIARGVSEFTNNPADPYQGLEDTVSGHIFYDVVTYNDTLYYCKVYQYNNTAAANFVPGYTTGWQNVWGVATNFEFVATDLLFASNAYIEYITNKGFYLKDQNDNVVGGAQGGGSDTDVIFFAGPNGLADLSTANFLVRKNGSVTMRNAEIIGSLVASGTGDSSVSIRNGQITVADTDGVQRINITSNNITPATPSLIYPFLNRSAVWEDTVYIGDQYVHGSNEYVDILLCSYTVPSGASRVVFPDIRLITNPSRSTPSSSDGITNIAVTFRLLQNGNNTGPISVTPSHVGNVWTFTLITPRNNPTAANYQLYARVSFDYEIGYQGGNQTDYDEWARLDIIDETAGSVVVEMANARIAQYGANGISICLGDGFQFVAALESGNPVIRFEGTKTGNVSVGLKITSSGIQVNRGSGYVDL